MLNVLEVHAKNDGFILKVMDFILKMNGCGCGCSMEPASMVATLILQTVGAGHGLYTSSLRAARKTATTRGSRQ